MGVRRGDPGPASPERTLRPFQSLGGRCASATCRKAHPLSVRNLDALFKPASIALIGASNRPGSIGAMLARNLLEGGFTGPVLPVNPHESAIRSALAYASVE